MELQLKNIGMIKEANVKIDGLTVIAGENDTGKSTVGKALYLIYYSMPREKDTAQKLGLKRYNMIGSHIKEKIFSEKFFNKNSKLSIIHNGNIFVYTDKFSEDNLSVKDIGIASIAFIETPIVWNLQYLFRTSSDIESHLKMIGENIKIPYPYLLKDLYFKLVTKRDYFEEWTKKFRNKIISIIGGEFIKDEDGIFRFYKNKIKYDLIDIATGIKIFGVLQILLDNNRLNSYSLVILDEPEVHLHPKWQLEMAKIIVELVKNGVKVLVTSHSPYIIEALKRYSEVEEIEEKTNFYLSENGYIEHQDSLENIFEKLALPMRELKKLKMDRYLND